jgi:hypothetical protein
MGKQSVCPLTLTEPVKWVCGWEHTAIIITIIIIVIVITVIIINIIISMFPFLWGSTGGRKSITTRTSIWNLPVGFSGWAASAISVLGCRIPDTRAEVCVTVFQVTLSEDFGKDCGGRRAGSAAVATQETPLLLLLRLVSTTQPPCPE